MQKLNKKRILIITTIIIVSIVTFFFTFKNILNKKIEELPEVKLKEIKETKTIAVMIPNDEGNGYKEYKGEMWPGEEYEFIKSECVDNNGKRIENAITYEEETIILETEKTIYCTLYFDYKETGEKTRPYKIKYIEDLVDLQIAVNNGETFAGKYFELERDLDFQNNSSYRDYQSKEYKDINGNEIDEEIKTELTSGSGWIPIGNSDTNSFQGTFDGGSYTLANLYINNSKLDPIGLFGNSVNATFKNLKINGTISTSITASSGGLVGICKDTVINNIEINVKNDSNSASYSVGGIIGGASGNVIISNSKNYGNISNSNNTGGIVGYEGSSSTLTLENVENYGNITNNKGAYLGGLVGRNNDATSITNMKQCANFGTILSNIETEAAINAGGLIGRNNGTLNISNSHNDGIVKNERTEYSRGFNINAGGFVGYNVKTITIENSYNIGAISGGNRTGGIIGFSNATDRPLVILDNVYNKGQIDSSIAISGYASNAGGLVGYSYATIFYILNSYNLGNVHSLKSVASGLVGALNNNSSAIIINSYNIGKITNDSETSSGITYTAEPTSYSVFLQNVYNLGNLESKKVYSLVNIDDTEKVKNSYYVNNNNNLQKNIGISMDITAMKNQTFVDTLNNNMYQINLSSIDAILKDYKLNGWILGSDGYPTFAKNIKDLSGKGNDGISFATSWTDEGITTSNDVKIGYVYMGLENYDFDKDLTFVTRVKFNKLGGYQEFFGNWDGAGGGFALNENKIRFNLYNEDLSQPGYVGTGNSNFTINPNVWYTIVGTYDNKEIKLYINGEKDISVNTTGGIKPSPAFTALGQNPLKNSLSSINDPSYTTFSDALIFDRTLSEEEIKENYSDIPNPVNKDELILWYKFN